MSGNDSPMSNKNNKVIFDLGKECWIQIARHKVFHASYFAMNEKGVFAKGKFENEETGDPETINFFSYSVLYWIRFKEADVKPQG